MHYDCYMVLEEWDDADRLTSWQRALAYLFGPKKKRRAKNTSTQPKGP
jgi:hypothetical protein